MSDTIVVACPECQKKIKAPIALQGKKVKCKSSGCTGIIAVPGPKKTVAAKPTAAKAVKSEDKPEPADSKKEKYDFDAELQDGKTGYGVAETVLSTRCPHCAKEMEEDQIVCLNCGYNTATRTKAKRQHVIANTPGEIFVWLLPGFGALLGIGLLITLAVVVWMNAQTWVKDMGIDEYLNSGAFVLWTNIIAIAGTYYLGWFAIQRLILHPTPPEKEKS